MVADGSSMLRMRDEIGDLLAAYAAEMAHFFDVLAGGASARKSIEDGVRALALEEAATTSRRERSIVEL